MERVRDAFAEDSKLKAQLEGLQVVLAQGPKMHAQTHDVKDANANLLQLLQRYIEIGVSAFLKSRPVPRLTV